MRESKVLAAIVMMLVLLSILHFAVFILS